MPRSVADAPGSPQPGPRSHPLAREGGAPVTAGPLQGVREDSACNAFACFDDAPRGHRTRKGCHGQANGRAAEDPCREALGLRAPRERPGGWYSERPLSSLLHGRTTPSASGCRALASSGDVPAAASWQFARTAPTCRALRESCRRCSSTGRPGRTATPLLIAPAIRPAGQWGAGTVGQDSPLRSDRRRRNESPTPATPSACLPLGRHAARTWLPCLTIV